MAFRGIQKLVRNGHSTQLTIPKQLLTQLTWIPGETVVLELMPDNTISISRLEIPKRTHVPRAGIRLDEAEVTR